MLSDSENILQTLTGKSSLNYVSEDELKHIADKYPYFGAAQFLLAKKLYSGKTENYKTAIQKAALHFTNELWLNYNFLEEDLAIETNGISILEENDFENLPEPISETDKTEATDETETASNENLSYLLKKQAAAFESPVEETALPVETTAYHRIDYFESQGIKLEEEKADDKLGMQLKRFTDWLKQMKSISHNLNNLETDAAGESQVKNMAEHSNEPKEIVTEAMADVLIKQGKPEQAIQIYEKLSFINPSKSAYFAAKIQELKA